MPEERYEPEFSDELIAEGRKSAPGETPDDMPPVAAFLVSHIDRFSFFVGRTVCWLVPPIFLAMVYEIIARKLYVAPTLWAYDVSRMLYGALFMLGSGYALMRGVHIRADFIYRNWRRADAGCGGFFNVCAAVFSRVAGVLFCFGGIYLGGVGARRARFGYGLDAICGTGAHGVAGGDFFAACAGRFRIA